MQVLLSIIMPPADLSMVPAATRVEMSAVARDAGGSSSRSARDAGLERPVGCSIPPA
jgi:hypothetical protein